MNTLILFAALASAALPAAPIHAGPPAWAQANGQHARDHGHDRTYDRYGRYSEPRALSGRDRVWRGNDGRYHCRRSNGTTGLVVGAVGGALVGRTVDTRGDRTLGTVLGAVGGGLLGRGIDRGGSRCR
jgi:hypothetical protein